MIWYSYLCKIGKSTIYIGFFMCKTPPGYTQTIGRTPRCQGTEVLKRLFTVQSFIPFEFCSRTIFLYLFIYFIYFWLRWVFVAVRGLSLVAASRGYSSLRCPSFSLRWLLLLRTRALGTQASVAVTRGLSCCGSRALEQRLSSCGAWAQLLHGMWDLPGPGLEPMSPALAVGFLTTAPPGKSLAGLFYLFKQNYNKISIVYKNTVGVINRFEILKTRWNLKYYLTIIWKIGETLKC